MHPDVADLLTACASFQRQQLALAAAVAALEDRKFVAKSCRITDGHEGLERGLKALGSGSSLVRQFPHVPRVAGEDGVREAAAPGCHRQAAGELRYARSFASHRGTPKRNEKFLKALRTALDD